MPSARPTGVWERRRAAGLIPVESNYSGHLWLVTAGKDVLGKSWVQCTTDVHAFDVFVILTLAGVSASGVGRVRQAQLFLLPCA